MDTPIAAYDSNIQLGLASADFAPSRAMTAMGDIQKVSTFRWSSAEAKGLMRSWMSENSRAHAGKIDVNVTHKHDLQNVNFTTFVENKPIRNARLPRYSAPSQLQPSLQPIQEWEGYVTRIDNKTFNARLVDLTSHQVLESEEGQFPLFDVSDGDMPYLQVGAVFRWVIGYSRSSAGIKSRSSRIFFRKRPAHTRYDLMMAEQAAERFAKNIEWE